MTDSARAAIIQYWHDANVPPGIERRMESVREHNPTMRHLVFNRATAMTFIRTYFSEREVAAFGACAVPAMQSDYFRYCAVYILGGVYCDADIGCSGSLSSLLDGKGEIFYAPAGTKEPSSATPRGRVDSVIQNGLFGFSAPGHLLLELALAIATTGIESRFCQSVTTVTGPAIFTSLERMWRRGVDPFLESMSSLGDEWYSVISADPEQWLRHLESVRAIVGDDSRVSEAFEGVRISPVQKVARFMVATSTALSYRQTEDHHPNWAGSIYC